MEGGREGAREKVREKGRKIETNRQTDLGMTCKTKYKS